VRSSSSEVRATEYGHLTMDTFHFGLISQCAGKIGLRQSCFSCTAATRAFDHWRDTANPANHEGAYQLLPAQVWAPASRYTTAKPRELGTDG
jgi:hypothetical protein